MKRRKYSQKAKAGKNSFFSVFILSLILLFLAVFLYKINSSVIFNSRAGGCFCGDLKCFNGNNFSKAYIEKGSNGKPQCCFGWPTGTLKNVKKNTCDQISASTPVSADTDLGAGDGSGQNTPTPTSMIPINNNCQAVSCNNLGLGLISTKSINKSVVEGITSYYSSDNSCTGTPLSDVVNYCSFSCKLGTVGYGYCKDQSVWQKINENYDPTKDQVKILGSFTDDKCTKSFVCNINATPTLTPTPTPVIKSKKIIIRDTDSLGLVMTGVGLAKYNSSSSSEPSAVTSFLKFGDSFYFLESSGYKFEYDLTNDSTCQKDPVDPSVIYQLKVIYRENGFFSMFFPKILYQNIPCSQDNFTVEVPLVY